MARINITETDEISGQTTTIGWFDYDRAEKYREATSFDGHNNISVNTGRQFEHEMLLRTAQGRWVLRWSSDYQGTLPTFRYVTDDEAREWLIRNDEDEAVEKYFGPVEEERGPGRPAVGNTISVALGDLLPKVDEWAKSQNVSRAEAVRTLLAVGLANRVLADQDRRFVAQVGTDKAAWLAQPASLGTTETQFTDLGDGRVRFNAATLNHLLGLGEHDDATVDRDEHGNLTMWIGGTDYEVTEEQS